jgi:exosortase O
MASTATSHAAAWRLPKPERVADVCLFGAWLWLVHPSLAWIADNLTRASGRLNLVLAVAIVGLSALKLHELRRDGERLQLRLSLAPLPMILFVAGGIAFVASERLVGVNRLSLFASCIGTYGLVGLYLPPGLWRRGLVPGLLLFVVLPMAEQVDLYVGFPARTMTADVVHQALAGLVRQDVTAQTILVFENGAAQVDLPCSGVKRLWAGAVLSLAATWLDGRRLDWRWLVVNAVFVVLLLSANVVRVLSLVLVGIVLDEPAAAELLHVSLGLIGFATSSALFLILLRRLVPRRGTPGARVVRGPEAAPRLRLLLTTLVIGLVVAWAPRSVTPASAEAMPIILPDSVVAEPVRLTAIESKHFREQGAVQATKLRFAWQGATGTLLVVLTETFRAHHLPLRCIEAAGLEIESRTTELLDPRRPISRVVLRGHGGDAAYWFQSASATTDDYSARVWADVSGVERRWILVSVLLDEQPENPHELFRLIHDAAHASFFGGTP